MSHRIALTFEEDATFFIDCNDGESLVDAGDRAGVRIPTDCRDGVCGTCRSLCESGTYTMSDDYLEEALTDEEAAEGFILACQTTPLSDMVVRVPVASTVAGLSKRAVPGSIQQVNILSSSTAEVVIDTGSSSPMHFLPGQYAGLEAGGLDRARNYSFSNQPGTPFIKFLIRLVPDGGMSQYLAGSAAVGDPVDIHGPQGAFYLRDIQRPLVFVAGGTGLAPFLAMLESRAGSLDHPQVTLLLGVTNDEDLVKVEELEAFKASHPWFDFQYRIANPKQGGPAGLVTDLFSPELAIEQSDLYLCGPPVMVEAVHRYIRSEGRAPVRIFAEKFLVEAAPSLSEAG
ncbi:2Fe-2S iron-sulfur cluster binding domain-containing protein [Nocardioides sp. KIGAM211]|uniref:2Fe-2S iron-sulfur cluster binding domain-containing protein n=1 Tax=Nocardioides luti TaxID=2761101 RepID=A0A7X0VB25_9ACTN|nr:2Fe-2S iron-sulfur cluster-binding protein [Nocardioides luti]MBB6627522.1 2Fe-2S iron-sulfur cluster binding domain-containing protein [Nocardioides luti]